VSTSRSHDEEAAAEGFRSGDTRPRGAGRKPHVVIANYIFDASPSTPSAIVGLPLEESLGPTITTTSAHKNLTWRGP